MMVEAAPVTPLVLMQAEFRLQFLMVPLDSPATHGSGDEGFQ